MNIVEGNTTSIDLNRFFLKWKKSRRENPMQREYRSLSIDSLKFKDFEDRKIQDFEITANGGGYYNVIWGLYRDIETDDIFIYYYSRNLHTLNDEDIKHVEFVKKTIGEIKRDTL